MKLLLVSDIHSNIWSLEAILKAEPQFDLFCCAGDLVDYGIAPAEVLAELRRLEPRIVVQGNHDRHLVEVYREGRFGAVRPADFKWVHHNCRLLSASDVDYLESLPSHGAFEADGWSYLLQHQYSEGYETIESLSQFDAYWRDYAPSASRSAPRRRMIFGHSHRQCVHSLGTDTEWINPGSSSYRRPDDPDKTAHYAVIDDGEVTLKRIPYDRGALLAEAKSFHERSAMMETELQDFYFFFGDARSSRDPLPPREAQ